jgi:hypothetical protein
MNTESRSVSALDEAVLINPYVELVPSRGWRERMAQGLKPSLFFSIRGDILAGNETLNIEVQGIQATDADGALRLLGIEHQRASDGAGYLVCPPQRQKSFAAIVGDEQGNAKLDAAGMPVLAPGEALAEGWEAWQVVKSTVFTQPGKTLKLKGVSLSFKDATTAGGHRCADARIQAYEVVDAPRIEAAGGKATAAPKFGCAARATSRATAATVV